jgi:DNA mismatch repair protein MSH2
VQEITKRLDTVQAFVEGLELRQDLRSHLRRMPDIERLVSRLEKRKAGLQDVVKLYQVQTGT